MNRQTFVLSGILLLAVGLVLTVIGSINVSTSRKTSTTVSQPPDAGSAEASQIRRDVLISARYALPAPTLSDGTWINSKPLQLDALRGRVVIVDFWTFGCYNCRNTLPSLKQWDASYRDKGLTIIGVHSPESDYEKNEQNVRREVGSLGIRYPVVTDNDYATWRAYGIEAWPTTVILDKQGRIRWMHVGEGYCDRMEKVIQALLTE